MCMCVCVCGGGMGLREYGERVCERLSVSKEECCMDEENGWEKKQCIVFLEYFPNLYMVCLWIRARATKDNGAGRSWFFFVSLWYYIFALRPQRSLFSVFVFFVIVLDSGYIYYANGSAGIKIAIICLYLAFFSLVCFFFFFVHFVSLSACFLSLCFLSFFLSSYIYSFSVICVDFFFISVWVIRLFLCLCWTSVLATVLFIMFVDLWIQGVGPVVWLCIAELSPASVRRFAHMG